MAFCNTTLENETVDGEVPYSGNVTFHDIGLLISAIAGGIAIIISMYLIFQHALHYSRPWEQKHIIRILFMVPIYALVSFLSYYYYLHTIYWQVLRDCYEAFAIASFFTLMCNYIASSLHDQKQFFRFIDVKNWILPLNWLQKCTGGEDKGLLRKPRSGLTWFNIAWNCVFQYCFIRVLFTIVSVAAQADGRYCQSSNNPAFAHIWALVFESVSVTIAMYGLVQFYVQLKGALAPHRPGFKLVCIKLVIFFSFWQSLAFSFASSSDGPFHPTPKIKYPDIAIGIPNMVLCIEMVIFAVMHLFAYGWKPYRLASPESTDPSNPFADGDYNSAAPKEHYHGGVLGLRAFLDAFNPWDIIKAIGRGFRWLFVGRRFREQDVSYSYHEEVHGHGLGGVAAKADAGHGALGERDDASRLGPVLANRGGQSDGALSPPPPPPPKDGTQYLGAGASRTTGRDASTERPSFDEVNMNPTESWSPISHGGGGTDRAGLLLGAAPPARSDPRDAMGRGW